MEYIVVIEKFVTSIDHKVIKIQLKEFVENLEKKKKSEKIKKQELHCWRRC